MVSLEILLLALIAFALAIFFTYMNKSTYVPPAIQYRNFVADYNNLPEMTFNARGSEEDNGHGEGEQWIMTSNIEEYKENDQWVMTGDGRWGDDVHPDNSFPPIPSNGTIHLELVSSKDTYILDGTGYADPSIADDPTIMNTKLEVPSHPGLTANLTAFVEDDVPVYVITFHAQ